MKTKIEELITELRSSLEKEEYENIESISQRLQNSLMDIGKMAAQAESKNTNTKDDGTVIDTDFSEAK